MAKSVRTAQEWKENGNEEFNKGNWSEALSHYTNALKLVKDNTEKGIYYKNRAAAYLKLHVYEKVIQDCNSALKICCNKALYRRCQALEALDRFEEAYRDAEIIISSDPNNKVIQLEATRLLELVQERRKENVSQMMDLAFNMSADKEKRKTTMINLLELARNEADAEEIFKKEGVPKIAQLVEVEKNEEVVCSAIRIVGELCQNNIKRTESVVKYVGLPWCLKMMNSTSTERVNASQYCFQNILNSYSGMTKEPDSKPDENLCKVHEKEIDTILSCLLNSVTSRTITGLARDAIIQLIMRNIHCVTALNWTERFVELRGLQKLMEVAGEMVEYKCESPMDITFSTRAIISVCLAKIYENMYYDTKEKFSNTINEFIKDKLLSPNTESKVRVIIAITTLIFGPLDVANAIIFKEGMVEMILAMAETGDVLEQKVVCECIVAAVTKYNEANVFICRGVKILEKLYQSKDDSVRVRALVGLCKLSRFEDTRCYVAIDPFANRATKTLAKVCRRFLINPKKEKDMRKWAIKSLSYLTCDDKVKEEFIEDQEAIQAMIELTKADDQSILHDVLMTLVNLCNAYEVQELPEMIELREFADQHFPEKYVLAYDYCTKRNCTLAKAGVTTALVNLTKTNSQNCKELIARVFFVICGEKESRDIVIRQGGTKALLSLALDGTDRGKNYATRALVYLGRTKLLEVAFPGQMMMEVVGPIINLLNPECSVPENRLILGVLCDLAKVSDNMREHIFKEGVFQKIATFVYEQDYFFKFLSLLLINILVLSHEVAVQYFRQDNSRVKYLTLLCKDENQQFSRLAASTLAMLTAANKEACKKLFDLDSWMESIRFLVTNPDYDIQKSGIMIVGNMMRSTRDVATKLMETDLMELLRSLSKNDNVKNNKIKALASLALGNVAERSSQEEFREAFINMNYSTVAKSVMTPHEWKEKGNEEFNKANWSKALSHYTNALKLKEDNAEKGLYYKNRAATYLKLRDYEKVVEDCDSALKICCNKALYRRCQALEALEKLEEAYRDAEIIISSDSNNKVIQSLATRLLEIVQERRKESSHISDKVAQMLNLAFNVSADKEKRETAMHNLLVLARERAGAEEIFKKEAVFKIAQLVEDEKNEEVVCSAIRIVCELCQNNISRTESVVKYVCLPWCLEMMNSTSTERVNASQCCLQNILNAYSGMSKEPDSKPDKTLCEAHKKEIDTILSFLLNNVTSRTITGLARDAIIQLIMRNIHCVTALDWTERFIELRGLQKLMEVASEMEEYKCESPMDVTFSTRAIISVCLAKIYENVYCDAAKEKFSNAINEFINDKLLSPNTESKVRVVVAITILIFGPLDVADAIICKKEVVEMILAMAETDDLLQQKVVCECIVAAMTKYNEVNVFIWRSRNILLDLYNSKHDSIRIRALVGLCKLTRFKDRLYSAIIRLRLSRDRASNKLAKICRRFLINPKKEEDMRKWAIKGLSYLTYDDNIKDELIEDQQAIQAIIEFIKTDDRSVLYAVLTTLVNLCNAYVEQEHIPEMIEWETFIEHHFEGYDSVDEYAVKRRLNVLANAGVTNALMSLANTDNQNYRELISRVFNSMCGDEKKVSEIVVQQGGTKVLLSLALDGTDKGKNQALQALVRLGLRISTIRPEVAFPGQMIMEVVRPIMNFLKPECSFWENYATLVVLCDLAKVSDNMREHIFKEGVFQKIEAFLYEEDHRLRCASTTLINILVSSREIAVQYFRQDNSRVKYLTLLCKDENENISRSAASALASLTSSTKEACKKVFDSDSWLESLRFLLINPDCGIQESGIVIVTNMMESTKDVAAKLMETDIMELLRALSKDDTVQNKRIKELAFIALEDAADRSNQEERREALLNMIRLDCDKARRSGQLDVLKFLQSELWTYEHTEHVSKNIHSEFAGIQTRRRLFFEKKTKLKSHFK